MKIFSRLILTIAFIVSSVSDSYSQMPADAYNAADSLLRLTADKVYYGNVMPEWIGRTNRFFYENLTPAGKEFIIVDAGKLSKNKAFNQEGLPNRLGRKPGRNSMPESCPYGIFYSLTVCRVLHSPTMVTTGFAT